MAVGLAGVYTFVFVVLYGFTFPSDGGPGLALTGMLLIPFIFVGYVALAGVNVMLYKFGRHLGSSSSSQQGAVSWAALIICTAALLAPMVWGGYESFANVDQAYSANSVAFTGISAVLLLLTVFGVAAIYLISGFWASRLDQPR